MSFSFAVRGVLAACALLFGAADAWAQGCMKCHGKGTLACTKHPKNAPQVESNVNFCSIVARCALCKGTLRLDCPDCHGKEEEEYKDMLAAQEKRIAEQLEFEKGIAGEPRGRCLTKHFDFTFEVEKLTVGREQLDQHQLLHLYADRIEKLHEMFNEMLGLRDGDHVCKRYRVMVWRNPLDNVEAQTRYTEGGSSGVGKKLLGARGVYTMCRDRNKEPQDDDLHRNLAHNIPHLFLASIFDGVWVGQFKAGWVDEGLSHWFEDKLFGQCTNFCYQEQNTNVSFRGGKWKTPVRGMVEDPKRPSFSETSNKTSDELTTPEHALAFSYVDYLLNLDGTKFPAMVKILKKKRPTREALQEAYGLTMFQFEEDWKKWVLATYSKR